MKTATLPSWFRQEIPDMNKIRVMKELFVAGKLHTVCESSLCPNMGSCWGQGVATFMILGGTCTRACRFCAMAAGRGETLDPHEPRQVALAVKELGLRYVVITSVARDDLEDEGALAFVKTIEAVRNLTPGVNIEVLIPDFSGKEGSLQCLSHVKPEVIAHNIETVHRLAPVVRPQASHDRSLHVLRRLRDLNPQGFVKSSLMAGLGETDDEIEDLMRELFEAGCQILTIGQYLAPTHKKRHVPVDRFLTPEDFERFRSLGMRMGFVHVESGALVRSSYMAKRGYEAAMGSHDA